ncbi:MAG: tetratricopeptide repeat protein [Acidobacteriota bacterium]
MTINLNLRRRSARFVSLAAILAGSAVLIGIALTHFAFAALTDPKLQVSREVLAAAASYYPNSARVQARLAAHLVESEVDDTLSHEQITEQAVNHAARAVRFSPRSYELRMISALAREAQGDLAGAETDLRAALSLAPYNLRVHWRLANLLIRAGKLDQAIAEFHIVNTGTAIYLPETMDLVWQASDGSVTAVQSAVGNGSSDNSSARMALARFFVQQAQFEPAANIFRSLDARQKLDSPVTPGLLDDLVAAGQVELAAQLWTELLSPEAQSNHPLIRNGGFETTIRKGLTQFDWNLTQGKYAQISLANNIARTGRRALEITYLGIDTTRLENEIRQLVPVRPGARYRLDAYAKAEDLVAPDAPQIAVVGFDSTKIIATSSPLETGSHDWQLLTIEFVAPPDSKAIFVTIKQTPRFSYVKPTRGTVWFDDFSLQQN